MRCIKPPKRLGAESYGLFLYDDIKMSARIRNGAFMKIKEYPLVIDLKKLHVFDRETGKNVKAV